MPRSCPRAPRTYCEKAFLLEQRGDAHEGASLRAKGKPHGKMHGTIRSSRSRRWRRDSATDHDPCLRS
eukprot:4503462-Pyramimonas_sp.AAC.1